MQHTEVLKGDNTVGSVGPHTHCPLCRCNPCAGLFYLMISDLTNYTTLWYDKTTEGR